MNWLVRKISDKKIEYFLLSIYPEPYANVNTSIQIFPVCALLPNQSRGREKKQPSQGLMDNFPNFFSAAGPFPARFGPRRAAGTA